LQERVVQTHRVDPRAEVRSRIQWIGWRWLLPAWGRALRLYVRNPAMRQSIKDQFDVPATAFNLFGYALMVGQK
jgi:hypothetical protein